ncbi:hypothetical protein FB472_1641 [Rhodoglobus vestalii]|uniref:Uncharacterized protein n=1 Tax=Rhodoglobus vestalii TaxID=193384 RepID=A0A8H2PY64_9MICO|nr:hypothetical protein FB472_1641 [Rhodoglobus vestalii]
MSTKLLHPAQTHWSPWLLRRFFEADSSNPTLESLKDSVSGVELAHPSTRAYNRFSIDRCHFVDNPYRVRSEQHFATTGWSRKIAT